jgi:hypothetical protein
MMKEINCYKNFSKIVENLTPTQITTFEGKLEPIKKFHYNK